ncbi:hypothetical protein D3C86_1986350 [compost metagenome]
MSAFYWRLSYYLILDLLILWHYRDRMIMAFKAIFNGLTTKFKFPTWAYLILPIMAIGLEILPFIPKLLLELILNPKEISDLFLSIWNKE